MAGNIAAFLLLALAIRQLRVDLSYPEILAVRSAGGVLISLAIGWRDPALFREIWRSSLPLNLGRSLLHAVGSVAVVWSVANLPLGLVASIDFSGPLFAAAIGFLVFRLMPTRGAWAGFVLIFAGAVLIVSGYMDVIGLAIIIPFVGVAVLTGTNIMLATLSSRQSTRSILFLMNATQLIVFLSLTAVGADRLGLPSASLSTVAALPHGPVTFVLAVVAMALSGYMTQASLSQATRYGTAVQVSALYILRIPVLAIAGAVFLDETIGRELIIPATVIMCGAFLVAASGGNDRLRLRIKR